MGVCVYILCHNRPDMARETLHSALRQSDTDFTLTISDNSTDDRTERMVREEFPAVRYVRRTPTLPAFAHFNQCIEDTADGHFCLFHDDDLMAPDFVREAKRAIQAYPGAVAFGFNARVESYGQVEPRPSFLARREGEVIASPRTLALRYFGRAQSGIAPFPGYVYSRALVGDARFIADAGKYSDVTWLMRLAARGPIVWINRAVMTYRVHGANDGLTESRRDRLRLLAALKRESRTLGEDVVEEFRCSFVYKPIVRSEDAGQRHPQRLRVARAFLKAFRRKRYLKSATYRALLERALVKAANRR
jgi:glycosyltransferase involved in cell wall biosynthesis